MAKCIADMPQEVKDLIVSGAAHVVREDKLDKLDNNMAETVTFARENPHMSVLMANTLQPTRDHKDKMDIAQTLTEFAHVASDIQWELKFTSDKNQALSSIASDQWKQFQLTEHSWYVKDPT